MDDLMPDVNDQNAIYRQQMLARMLMSQQADPKTQNAGLANVGNDILGAAIGRHAANQAADQRQGFPSAVNITPQRSGSSILDWANGGLSKLGGLFNFGGAGG